MWCVLTPLVFLFRGLIVHRFTLRLLRLTLEALVGPSSCNMILAAQRLCARARGNGLAFLSGLVGLDVTIGTFPTPVCTNCIVQTLRTEVPRSWRTILFQELGYYYCRCWRQSDFFLVRMASSRVVLLPSPTSST